jgi:hypothetical protein
MTMFGILRRFPPKNMNLFSHMLVRLLCGGKEEQDDDRRGGMVMIDGGR